MVKQGRNYFLTIERTNGEFLAITPPITVEFDITRKDFGASNTCSLRIFNLTLDNRTQIYKDRFRFDQLKRIIFRAGYGDNMPVVFQGNVSQAWSVREGTDYITQVECYDSGFAFVNGETNSVFAKGISNASIFESLINQLPDANLGAIGDYPNTLPRGTSFSGSITDILKELSGGGFFIDNGKAHVLGDNEAIEGELQVITSDSGLLGTPVREETFLNFDMIFEPRLILGQVVQLESVTAANFNSFYKVKSLHHRGVISGAVCGQAITSVGVIFGAGPGIGPVASAKGGFKIVSNA